MQIINRIMITTITATIPPAIAAIIPILSSSPLLLLTSMYILFYNDETSQYCAYISLNVHVLMCCESEHACNSMFVYMLATVQ